MPSRFVEIYKEEFSEFSAEILRILLFSDLLSCGEEEMCEGQKDNRDMVEVAQMMETIEFGML
jgi:hypothetical protein